jgi:nucleotide-binding universal stress UspA family protein
MYRNVLIPINLSEKEQRVVEAAARVLHPEAVVATLLHVIEEIDGLAGEEGDNFYAGLRERAEKLLEQRAATLSQLDMEVRREVVVGRRAQSIVGYASENRCDLIVMGSNRIDPDQPGRGLWATSQKVSLLAECPILLIR